MCIVFKNLHFPHCGFSLPAITFPTPPPVCMPSCLSLLGVAISSCMWDGAMAIKQFQVLAVLCNACIFIHNIKSENVALEKNEVSKRDAQWNMYRNKDVSDGLQIKYCM